MARWQLKISESKHTYSTKKSQQSGKVLFKLQAFWGWWGITDFLCVVSVFPVAFIHSCYVLSNYSFRNWTAEVELVGSRGCKSAPVLIYNT